MIESSAHEINEESKGAKSLVFVDFAVFFAGCWIVVALSASPLFRVSWFTQGDFSYSSAMYYHGIMVPVLILLYLLIKKILPLEGVVNKRIYIVGAMLAIFFVGAGSIFNNSKGFSVAVVVQITGMVMTDLLGIILVIAMAIFAIKKDRKAIKTGTAFWLLFFSILAILAAETLGHLAGWINDLGSAARVGGAPLKVVGLSLTDFLDGLIGSHSHLIVAAFLSALSALTALYFQYQSRPEWKRKASAFGLGMSLAGLLAAAVIYLVSAMFGWEPPAVFASGPNGIPLDDLILTAGEIGFLFLLVGLSGSPTLGGVKPYSSIQKSIRLAIFLNWIFGFIGVVILGVYIEFHENFYSGGADTAPGGLNDNIFIRAHLLYPFFILLILFTFLLAVGYKYSRAVPSRAWPTIFVWTAIIGMTLGLAGEILWFATRMDIIFVAAMYTMALSLVAGVIALWPEKVLV